MNFYDRRIVTIAIVIAFALTIYGFSDAVISALGPGATSIKSQMAFQNVKPSNVVPTSSTIPQIVHFIIGAASADDPVKLNFLAFLSIYSAGLYMPHAEIWLHTNASSTMIDRALKLEGLSPPQYKTREEDRYQEHVEITDAEYSEYWTQAVVKGVPNLTIKPIEHEHTITKTGKHITKWANWADFVRADVIYEHGGVFLDLDAVVLRNLDPLLKSGFRNILARDGETQCGVIMAAPKSDMMRAYRQLMDGAFDPTIYAFHATSLLHALRETFVRIPGELLMLSERSFYPISWNMGRTDISNVEQLFSIQRDNMLEDAHHVGDLVDFDYNAWIKTYVPTSPQTYRVEGSTGLDLSETYLLHVYHSQFRREVKTGRIKDLTNSHPSKLAHGLTLPLVLEGNSHFSRAVLKIVWHALGQDVITHI